MIPSVRASVEKNQFTACLLCVQILQEPVAFWWHHLGSTQKIMTNCKLCMIINYIIIDGASVTICGR